MPQKLATTCRSGRRCRPRKSEADVRRPTTTTDRAVPWFARFVVQRRRQQAGWVYESAGLFFPAPPCITQLTSQGRFWLGRPLQPSAAMTPMQIEHVGTAACRFHGTGTSPLSTRACTVAGTAHWLIIDTTVVSLYSIPREATRLKKR
jgi:hypothetical protein